MEAYLELHSRSAFSFLEGASLPEELAAVCADIEMAVKWIHDKRTRWKTAG